MRDLAYIEAEVTFLPVSEGGREKPPPHLSGCEYRPHLVLGDPKQRKAILIGNVIQETCLGIAFLDGPENARANQQIKAKLALMYWPDSVYDLLVPEATFTVREGPRIVAFGKVNNVFLPQSTSNIR